MREGLKSCRDPAGLRRAVEIYGVELAVWTKLSLAAAGPALIAFMMSRASNNVIWLAVSFYKRSWGSR